MGHAAPLCAIPVSSAERRALDALQRNPWLGALPSEALAAFAAMAEICRVRSGERFAAKGSTPPGLGVILKGAICASSFSDQGHEFALSMLEFGDIWGLAALFDGQGMLRESRAYGETEVLLLPREPFLAVLAQEPALYAHFVRILCGRVRTAHAIIDDLALRPLRQRLARLLCVLAAPMAAHDVAGVAQTQDTLAALLGVSRHAVNRELKQLQDLGLVRLGYGSVLLPDPAGLARLCAVAEA